MGESGAWFVLHVCDIVMTVGMIQSSMLLHNKLSTFQSLFTVDAESQLRSGFSRQA